MPETRKEPFFTRNRSFYRALFTMLITLALQNLIAYSVNMADNIMLGSYSQPALSGAAAVAFPVREEDGGEGAAAENGRP